MKYRYQTIIGLKRVLKCLIILTLYLCIIEPLSPQPPAEARTVQPFEARVGEIEVGEEKLAAPGDELPSEKVYTREEPTLTKAAAVPVEIREAEVERAQLVDIEKTAKAPVTEISQRLNQKSIFDRKKLFTKILKSVGIKGSTTKQLKRVGIETIPDLQRQLYRLDTLLEDIPEKKRKKEIKKLRKATLLSLLSDDAALNTELAKHDLNTIRDFDKLTISKLVKYSGGKLTEAEAKAYKNRVRALKNLVNLKKREIFTKLRNPDPLYPSDDLPPEAHQKIAQMVSGGADGCALKCDETTNLFSPAVYLLYLLDFVEKSFGDSLDSLTKINKRFKQKFEDVAISSDINQQESYIKYTNEVLENLIAEILGEPWPNEEVPQDQWDARNDAKVAIYDKFKEKDANGNYLYKDEPGFEPEVLNDLYSAYVREFGVSRDEAQFINGSPEPLKQYYADRHNLDLNAPGQELQKLRNLYKLFYLADKNDLQALSITDQNISFRNIQDLQARLLAYLIRNMTGVVHQEFVSSIEEDTRREFEQHYHNLIKDAVESLFGVLLSDISSDLTLEQYEQELNRLRRKAGLCVNTGAAEYCDGNQYENNPINPIKELFVNYANRYPDYSSSITPEDYADNKITLLKKILKYKRLAERSEDTAVYSFPISLSLQSVLNNGNVTPNLKDEFNSNSVPLSNNAVIPIALIEKGKLWMLIDEDNKRAFIIRKEKEEGSSNLELKVQGGDYTLFESEVIEEVLQAIFTDAEFDKQIFQLAQYIFLEELGITDINTLPPFVFQNLDDLDKPFVQEVKVRAEQEWKIAISKAETGFLEKIRQNLIVLVLNGLRIRPNGSLLLYRLPVIPERIETYLIESGKKRPISRKVAEHQYRPQDFLQVTTPEIDVYPDSPAKTFRDGTLLKGTGPAVYVMEHEKKRHITSMSVFQGLGYKWQNVVTVEDAELEKIPTGEKVSQTDIHPDGSLLKGSGPAVYVLENGKKRHIISPKAFQSYRYKWSQVITITDDKLSIYPEGRDMTFRDGTLLKTGGPAVYVMENEKKRHIPNPKIFTALGYKWSNIINISDTEFEKIPTGEPIPSTFIIQPNIQKLANYLHLDLMVDETYKTTQLAFGIRRIQSFIQAFRLGTESVFKNSNFNEDIWSWLKSYGIWNASMAVTNYPENFLTESYRPGRTDQFDRLINEINAGGIEAALLNYINFSTTILPRIKPIGTVRHNDRLYIFAYYYESDAPNSGSRFSGALFYSYLDKYNQWSGWVNAQIEKKDEDIRYITSISDNNRIYLITAKRDPIPDDMFNGIYKLGYITFSEKTMNGLIRLTKVHEDDLVDCVKEPTSFNERVAIIRSKNHIFVVSVVYQGFANINVTAYKADDELVYVGSTSGGAFEDSTRFEHAKIYEINDHEPDEHKARFLIRAYNQNNDQIIFNAEIIEEEHNVLEHRFRLETLKTIQPPTTLEPHRVGINRMGGILVENKLFIFGKFWNQSGNPFYFGECEAIDCSNMIWQQVELPGGTDNSSDIPFSPQFKMNHIYLTYLPHDDRLARKILSIDTDLSNFKEVISTDIYKRSSFMKIGKLEPTLVQKYVAEQRDTFLAYSDKNYFIRKYFKEYYYHIPMLIAKFFMDSQHHNEALIWLKRVYDPFQDNEFKRLIYYGFKENIDPTVSISVKSWLEDPFNPYAFADLYKEFYLLNIKFTHVINFLDWADHLFTQDTNESVNRARELYELAAKILDMHDWPEDPCDLQWHTYRHNMEGISADQRSMVSEIISKLSNSSARDIAPRIQGILSSPACTTFKVAAVKNVESMIAYKERLGDMIKTAENVPDNSFSDDMALSGVESIEGLGSVTIGEEIPGIKEGFCLPMNPLVDFLRWRINSNLAKIKSNRNFAGIQRQLQPYATPVDPEKLVKQAASGGLDFEQYVPSTPPPIYRYSFLLERAKYLVSVAQQYEDFMLSTIEKEEQEAYTYMKAKQDMRLERGNVTLQGLRLNEAFDSKRLAEKQKDRASFQWGHYDWLLNKRLSGWEQTALAAQWTAVGFQTAATAFYGASAAAEGTKAWFTAGMGADPLSALGATASSAAAAFQATSSVAQMHASFERRRQEWEFQRVLSQYDIDIADIGIDIAVDRIDIVNQEKNIANLRLEFANDTVEFLGNKFTNKDLYNWMNKNLRNLYREQLNIAISTAKAAQRALEFERQSSLDFIGYDYWDDEKRGILGAEKLLKDINKMDQFRITSASRKKEIEKTISLASISPAEFQRFRETGVLEFETLPQWFDQDFPGHYMRLLRDVRVSVFALVSPIQGIHATLSNPGISRVMVGDPFEEPSIVYRLPESIAISSPYNATGLFELRPDDPMLLPFEGNGVATTWRLEMPKAANRFDFNTMVDVLFTVRYTALEDRSYREKVLAEMGQDENGYVYTEAVRFYSVRNSFPDAWYHFKNPVLDLSSDKYLNINDSSKGEVVCGADITENKPLPPNIVLIELAKETFLPNEDQRKIKGVTLSISKKDGREYEDKEVTADLIFLPDNCSPNRLENDLGNIANYKSTQAFNGRTPFGKWIIAVESADGDDMEWLEDLLLVIEYEAKVHYNR